MKMFNPRSLRAFVAIAEEGHITRAAGRLGLQQPHLTRLLKGLEATLGTALMVRTPHGVVPTAGGLVFLAEARAILARLQSMPDLVGRAARGETGRLSIGFTSSSGLHPFISAGLQTFRGKYPAVTLTMEEAGTGELVDALHRGMIDAAFVRTPIRDKATLTVDAILVEPMVLAVPTSHAMAGRPHRKVAMPLLADEPFILYRRPSGPGLYDAIVTACNQAGFSPIIVQEAPRLTATVSLVAAGLGISLVPASMRNLALKTVRFLDLDTDRLVAPIELVFRTDDPNPALTRFRDLMAAMKGAETHDRAIRTPT